MEQLSSMFHLNVQDLTKGLILAILAVVLGTLQQMVTAHGLDFASYDWNAIFTVAVTAGISYLMKNFLSDANGAVFGKFGGIKQQSVLWL